MKKKNYLVYLKKLKRDKIKRLERLGNMIVDFQEERDILRIEIEELEKETKNSSNDNLWPKEEK